MSELEDLCRALDESVQSLPGLVGPMQQRASRLRQVAAQVYEVARRVPDAPNVSHIVDGLNEAASATDRSTRSLTEAVGQARAYVERTVGGGGGGGGGGAGSAGGGGAGSAGGGGGLSGADLAALDDYTGSGYREMNEALRGRTAMNEDVERRAEAVSDALAKLPDYAGMSYRGTTLPAGAADRYQVGSVVCEPGFTSTSSNPSCSFPGDTIFVVHSLHGKDVSPYSQFSGESEILFDRGANFEVTRNDVDSTTGRRVIVMREVEA